MPSLLAVAVAQGSAAFCVERAADHTLVHGGVGDRHVALEEAAWVVDRRLRSAVAVGHGPLPRASMNGYGHGTAAVTAKSRASSSVGGAHARKRLRQRMPGLHRHGL